MVLLVQQLYGLFLNIGYVFFEIPIMHRRLLRKEKWRWYWQDVIVPLIAGLFLAGLGRLILNNGTTSQFMMLVYLMIISVLTLLITLISVPNNEIKIIWSIKLN